MDAEDFKNIAQGVQAISIALAAIAGGFWAVFKLYSSKELDKSRLEAIKAKKEFDRTQGLVGSIEVEVGDPLENKMLPVFFIVSIENLSTETYTLDWHNYPLKIASVATDDSDDIKLQVIPKAKLVEARINPVESDTYWSTATTMTILPNTKREMSLFWECTEEGVYLACVSSPLPESIVEYLHSSDNDKIIHRAKEKYNDELENYIHSFNFVIEKYFQVNMPNKKIQRTV